MKATQRKTGLWGLVVAAGLTATTGCQTWFPEAGLTLPTGHYLRHAPQYFPPSPDFPLTRELTTLEEAHQKLQQGQ